MCHGQLLDSAIRQARKRYQCVFCYGPISPGEQHSTFVFADDGTVFTQRQCLRCAAYLRESDVLDDDGCVSDLREGVRGYAAGVGWKAFLGAVRDRIREFRKGNHG